MRSESAITIAGRRRRPARRMTVLAAPAALLALVALVGAPHALPAAGTPAFRVTQVHPIGLGAEYVELVRDEGPVVAHVVRVPRTAPLRLQTVLSNDRVGPPGPISERTSEMCRRVGCLAAVNGDFSTPGTGQPVGGISSGGRLLRSPVATHDQLTVSASGELTAGPEAWWGRLLSEDGAALALSGLNREREDHGVVLYTSDFGASTGTDPGGVEVVLRAVDPVLALGRPGLVEVVATHEGGGNTPIPGDGVVVSGAGDGAFGLRAFVAGARPSLLGNQTFLQIQMGPGPRESVGISPVLVRDGETVVVDDGSGFVSGRHPRTLVGWNGSDLFLVAVDGRQDGHSAGVSLGEAAALLVELGAAEGVNLDGGGSTTMAVGGTVVNRPSDHLVRGPDGTERVVAAPRPGDEVLGPVERPVADALAVVPAAAGGIPILSDVADLLATVLRAPGPAATPVAPATDPASQP